ncbi:MAG: putative histidine protein kinase [Nitrospirae bacterium]|nr:putative histidine protein kinase [Nitrospirota bacterium]
MDGQMTREDFDKALEEMRRKFLELDQCRIEYQSVQKRYEQLLQSAPDAMVFVDKNAKIVLVNAQLGSLFGYTEEELTDMDLDCLVPVRYRGRHRENVARYFEQPRVRFMGSDLAIYGLRKDGSEFPADISLSPLETDGGIFAVGAVRDITARKKAEEEKQRLRDQLAEAEKLSALGRIAANVADEIRNPLTTVGGFARRLHRIADSEKEREYAAYIISEVGRLEGVLRDVLAFSRTRSPLLEDHDIREIFDEVLETWEERFGRQAIIVQKRYGGDTVVRVDRTQVSEAIGCIIENAVDAMPRGGTLSIVIDRETVSGAPYVRVKLQDTGEGIPAEKIGKVFEPFFTTKLSPKGTGLGLPIAKRIMEEAGGMVMIKSTQGLGTTVTLLFPDIRKV